jgi:TonB family protein
MSILTRLLYLFRSRTLDRELDEELSFHVEARIEQHIREGMNRTEAEAKANREFGNMARAKSAMREARVMKTSLAIAAAAVAALSIATGTWMWLRSAHSTLSDPAYFQVTDQDITPPAVVYERKPDYPEAAKQAKIQGTVLLQCIVQTSGVCDDVRITRPLDSMWLDQEATRALQQWRFRPGRRMGEPVPVQVNVEFSFTVRDMDRIP